MAITVQGASNTYSSMSETVPFVASDSPADVFTSTCWLVELDIANTSTDEVTVTVADKQDTPVTVCAITLQPGAVAPMQFGGRLCPGGVTIVASAASAATAFLRARQ